MIRRFLFTLALTAAAFAQTTPGTPAKPATPGAQKTTPAAKTPSTKSAKGEVGPNAAVITIDGLCSRPATTAAATPAKGAGCRTIVTRAEFERLLEALGPRAQSGDKGRIAQIYVRSLVMEKEAQKLRLESDPLIRERIWISRVGVLGEAVQDYYSKHSTPTDADIAAFYKANPKEFDEIDLRRVFIPRKPETAADKTQDAATKQYADSLLARAKAGEDLDKLQQEAFTKADLKAKPPTTKPVPIHRGQLPEDQEEAVFALKKGEFSPVYEEQGAFVFYKVEDRKTQSLEDAKAEIGQQLEQQNLNDKIMGLFNTVKPTFNETYFAPPATTTTPPPSKPPL